MHFSAVPPCRYIVQLYTPKNRNATCTGAGQPRLNKINCTYGGFRSTRFIIFITLTASAFVSVGCNHERWNILIFGNAKMSISNLSIWNHNCLKYLFQTILGPFIKIVCSSFIHIKNSLQYNVGCLDNICWKYVKYPK